MTTSGLRIGIFGRLASGNLGNDVSMEAMLAYLRSHHADDHIDAMCPAPERMESAYGITASPMFWQAMPGRRLPKPVQAASMAIEKCIDTFRVMAWVRKHDVVVIPGSGILEATLQLRPWETPYAVFLLSLSGRIFRTKVAFVSIGASPASARATRWLQNMAARLAYYRSFRDEYSRDSMARRGIDTSRDPLYPDLAFSLPLPYEQGDDRTVGIGVMQYRGGNADRARAAEINASYVGGLKQFAGWLVDNGHRVVLFGGDDDDRPVADEIVAHLRETRPGLADTAAVAYPVATSGELADVMQQASAVVATRYHNIICGLMLGKPTISISYGSKTAALMADAGLSEFSVPANPLDPGQLIERFTELRARAPELVPAILQSRAAQARRADEQYTLLAKEFFTSLGRSLRTSWGGTERGAKQER